MITLPRDLNPNSRILDRSQMTKEESQWLNCEKTPKCQFFGDKMENMPAAAEAMKEAFCMNGKDACARYVLSSSGRPVPPDLFPDMIERVRGIISQT
jgi:hypothetical protein